MIDEFTDAELLAIPTGEVFVYDIECYPNYFLIAFRHVKTDKHVIFEITPTSTFSAEKLRWFIWRFCIVGFNSNTYDALMMTLCLRASDKVPVITTRELKDASDQIVKAQMRPWQFRKHYGVQELAVNHVDLVEVAPLQASLKMYGGRLHCKTMQDLPYPDETYLTPEQAMNVKLYCCNDLEQTKLLLTELSPHIELRISLGKAYGRDFRSLSDAQVAEAIITEELKAAGVFVSKPDKPCTVARYKPPAYMGFAAPALQAALAAVAGASFMIADNGSAIMPPEVADLSLSIGRSVYKMGIGGLHSQEKEVAYYANDDTYIIDRDVASYYPAIILNQGLFPEHIGPIFLEIYRQIVNRRLAAKAAKDNKTSEGLKIAINGIFGKFGNIFSIVYAPELLLQVTLTGQLSLLMLIEGVESIGGGVQVVSGNTDGIVIVCPKLKYEDLNKVIAAWEKVTQFKTEETRYKAIYSRDVNSYIAVKDLSKEKPDEREKRLKSRFLDERLGVKTKGAYCERGSAQNSVLSKNPENLIVTDAVLRLIVEGKPIVETVKECTDIRRFLTVRRVDGGAVKDGRYLGRTVRWYLATATAGSIRYRKNGNTVPQTNGACPIMTLPDSLPANIDYRRYIKDAEETLYNIGYKRRAKSESFDFFASASH